MSMGEFVMVVLEMSFLFFFFSSRRRHTRCSRDWSSDMCSRSVGRVVRDLRHGGELGRCALAGPPFLKLGDGPRLAPHWIVVAPVDDGWLRGARGGDAGRRRRGGVGHLTRERDGGKERQTEGHEG